MTVGQHSGHQPGHFGAGAEVRRVDERLSAERADGLKRGRGGLVSLRPTSASSAPPMGSWQGMLFFSFIYYLDQQDVGPCLGEP